MTDQPQTETKGPVQLDEHPSIASRWQVFFEGVSVGMVWKQGRYWYKTGPDGIVHVPPHSTRRAAVNALVAKYGRKEAK